MSVISNFYQAIICRGISVIGNGKYVVDGLNDIIKIYIYIYQLVPNVQLLRPNFV